MVINLFLVQGEYENTIIIQKSEFICRIYRVNSIQEVNEKLNYIRKKHYDATHNCYAYILDRKDQIKVAKMLDYINEKIDVNNRINDNLFY